jgi:AraC-like DNA-binding protein
VRSFIQDDSRLTRKDALHLLPFGLHAIYMSSLVAGIIGGKIPWQTIIGTVDQKTYFFNYGPLPDRFHVMFRLGLMLFYLSLIWKLFLGKKFRDFVARNRETYPQAIRWISYFNLTITVNALFAVFLKINIFFIGTKTGLFYGDWVSLGLLMTLDLLIGYALLNPVVLFGLPQFRSFSKPKFSEPRIISLPREQKIVLHQENELIPVNEDTAEVIVAQEVAAPVLIVVDHPEEVISPAEKEIAVDERKKMDLLIARMNEYVALHRPYRHSEFNMQDLSRQLEVPEHHLAFIFRHILKKSFVDYRNELRVQHVVEVFKKGMPRELTMEAIGMDAGFNSRTTFFTVFKKHTGKTPTQYLRS